MKNSMKLLLKTLLGVIVLCSLTVAGHAEKPVFADNFESYSTGAFDSSNISTSAVQPEPNAFIAVDAVSSSAAIVSGSSADNKTKVLQLSATLNNPGFNVAGIAWNPAGPPSGNNTDKDLAHYTLEFDMALIKGVTFGNGGPGLDVNVSGQQTKTAVGLAVDVSSLTVNGGFKHFSVTLDQNNKPALDRPALDPTDQSFRIEFNLVGGVSSATDQAVAIDNVRLTVKKP
jgi:hypothetical protein